MKKLVYIVVVLISFNSPITAQQWSLRQCVDTALKNNLTILQAKLTVQSYGIDVDQGRWNQYPSVSGSVQQNLNSGRTLSQSAYKYSNQNSLGNNYAISSGVILYNANKLRNSILQSQLNEEASTFDLQKQKDDISLSVVNAYLQIIYDMEGVKNAQNALESIQHQINDLKIFVQVGKRAESDLQQLIAEEANEKYTFSLAEGQLRNDKLSLQQLMEVPFQEDFTIEVPPLPDPQYVPFISSKEIYQIAVNTQPVIKSNALKIKSAQAGRDIVRAALLPTIKLNAAISSSYLNTNHITNAYTTQQLQDIGYLKSNEDETVVGFVPYTYATAGSYPYFSQVKDNFYKTVSIVVSIPIFSNKQVQNNIRKQDLAIQSAQLDQRSASNQLRKTVEQAYVEVSNAFSNYHAAKEALNAAEIAYQNLQLKFGAGKNTATDLLIERNKYLQAQSQVIQAKYNFILKQKVLDFYQGKTLIF